MGEGDEEPLGGDFLAAAEVETGKSDGTLDNAEDRFEGLFAFSIARFTVFAFEFRLHRQAPGFPDAALGFGLGRRAEVVGSVRWVRARATSGSIRRASSLATAAPLAKPASARTVRGRPMMFSMARIVAAKVG